MAKKKQQFGKDAPPLPCFNFDESVDQAMEKFKELGRALNDVVKVGPVPHEMENEFGFCRQIANAVKADIQSMGISREAFCDRVNAFLGRTQERYKQRPRQCRKPLSKAMLDKMISDPIQYPLDSYYLYAFQHITGGFGVMDTILGAKGARVVSGEDLRKFALIKAQELRAQAQILEKSIGRM